VTAVLLVVYGDSLGLPRNALEVRREDTYAELVAARLCEGRREATLYNRSLGGVPIGRMLEHFTADVWYFGPLKQATCIIQLGIVDCAPRPVTSRDKARIDRLPAVVRQPVIATIRRWRPTLIEHGLFTRETSEEDFRAKLAQFVRLAADNFGGVVVVNICPNHPDIEARSPKMPDSIAAYNRIIADVVADAATPTVRLADVFAAISAEGIDGRVNPADGHHINVAGHQTYAAVIEQAMRDIGR
jgi:lysophospholipase L1-like esterase